MQYKVQRASELSRQAFENLVTLWLTIVFLTLAAGILLASSKAKADIILPLPEAQLVYEPAILKSFSSSPAPALVHEKCSSRLHPQKGNILHSDVSNRTQRNAEPQGQQTTSAIMAIKAYRQCVSQIALSQLASK